MTVVNPNGTLTTTVTVVPTRVRRGGVWVPVDMNLAQLADGSWAPKAGLADVKFGGGGSGEIQSVKFGASQVGLSWPGVLPKPEVTGPTARYADVLPNTDLVSTVTPVGMETSLVVKSRPAAPMGTVSFNFANKGVAARMDAWGKATYTDASGKDVTFGSSSWAWDSYVDPVTGSPHMVPVTTTVVAGKSGSVLQVTVPDSFLADPSTVFPVTVDPPTSTMSQAAFADIDSYYPNSSQVNFAQNGILRVGTYNSGATKRRAMFIFTPPSMAGKEILKATFSTNLNYSWSCSGRSVEVWHTNPWGQGVTWNNQPQAGGPWTSRTVAKGYNSSCPGGAVEFDVTNLVTALAPSWGNYYFQLRAANEADNYGWKKFDPNTTLTIEYNTPPGVASTPIVTPCGLVCGPGAVTGSPTPSLSTTSVDTDGDNVAYAFWMWQGSSVPANPDATPRFREGWSAWVSSGVSGSWVPPALPDGQYVAIATAYDGRTFAPNWSAPVVFTVDTTPPAAASVSASGPFSLSPTARSGVVGKDVETVSFSGGSDVYGFWVGVAKDPMTGVGFPANVPACGGRQGSFTWVCGQTGSLAVTATDRNSTISVLAVDKAGLRATSVSTVSLYAVADQAAVEAGHAWMTQEGSGGCKDPAAASDVALGLDATLTPSTSDGLCWASPQLGLPLPDTWTQPRVLSFTSTATGYAATSTKALADTSKAFTVGAWVYPTSAGPTQTYPILAQEGSNEQVFYLMNGLNSWAFCMSNADTPSWAGDCVTTTFTVAPNEWVFVAATWDPINKQMRLFTSMDGEAGTPVVGTHASSWTANGPLLIGRDRIGTAVRTWRGQIASPMVFPGVLTSDQINNMGQQLPPGEW